MDWELQKRLDEQDAIRTDWRLWALANDENLVDASMREIDRRNAEKASRAATIAFIQKTLDGLWDTVNALKREFARQDVALAKMSGRLRKFESVDDLQKTTH